MNHPSRKHSSLFLMELIIAILFFAVTSAVCLQCFAKAHTLSKEATNTNQAVAHTENVAELLHAASQTSASPRQITEILELEYQTFFDDNGQWCIFFDKDWTNSSQESAVYTISITEQTAENGLHTYSIEAFQSESSASLYQLTVTLYAKE